MKELLVWIRDGGSLLLVADHAPIAAAARDLGAVLGVVMLDVYVDAGPGPDIFRRNDNTLQEHVILHGHAASQQIDSVMTFTGQAFQITQDCHPLLILGPEAKAKISMPQSFQEGPAQEWPSFSVADWVQGATRAWDLGRIVILGEAAMCTAQRAGPGNNPMGMNHPMAAQNAQFCLNIVRWLTRSLGP